MPICRSAACTLARSRATFNASPSKTLTPFLYQTPTIQQWRPITSRTAFASPSRNTDDIPFEGIEDVIDDDETLPPRVGTAPTPARKTTVTGGERTAFEKLYKKFSQDQKLQDEDDQIFDEYYEEDDDAKNDDTAATLDSLFDSVLETQQRKKRPAMKQPKNLQTMAEAVLNPEVAEAQRKKSLAARRAKMQLEAAIKQEKSRIHNLLLQTQTDREIWDVLTREVFDNISALDLDGKPTSLKRNADGTDLNPRVLFATLSSHLLIATRFLRKYHPTSPLPMQILPTLKSLGRSAYALGATTPLYNILLRTAWTQHASYTYLDNLLTDMENGGIEFDVSTLKILDGVCQEWHAGYKGKYGYTVKLVFRMDLLAEGVRKVEGWREVVRERVEKDMRRIRPVPGFRLRKVTQK
jgi:hypothetical protein